MPAHGTEVILRWDPEIAYFQLVWESEGFVYALQYGPFDLSDALTATLEFDLHLWSAQGDTFSWRASADGVTFFGQSIGETFPAVWNRQTLDLSAVPGLGDLRGDSTVWVSFTWQTDNVWPCIWTVVWLRTQPTSSGHLGFGIRPLLPRLAVLIPDGLMRCGYQTTSDMTALPTLSLALHSRPVQRGYSRGVGVL